jgi:hypothetical protein
VEKSNVDIEVRKSRREEQIEKEEDKVEKNLIKIGRSLCGKRTMAGDSVTPWYLMIDRRKEDL